MGEPVPARAELIRLACTTRPDWWERDIQAALVRAQQAGWPWTRTMTAVALLAADPHGYPKELAPATTSVRPADPGRTRALIDATKADLESRRPKGGGS